MRVTGKTNRHCTIPALTTLKKETPPPDLILVTVKSYDTKTATRQIQQILQPKTTVLTLQNGLDNVETLEKTIPRRQLLAGVVTHGALISTPGTVTHTGKGTVVIGELDGKKSERINKIAAAFMTSGLPTTISRNIHKDIWVKTIVNASINPVTAFFSCPNGYLLTNPVLRHVIDDICRESTRIAKADGLPITAADMIRTTRTVIRTTAQNSSSMLQSLQHGKPTEIDAMNAALVRIGAQHHIDTPLNSLLVTLIHWKEHQHNGVAP